MSIVQDEGDPGEGETVEDEYHQSNGKQFAKNILAILNSVKAREEGHNLRPAAPPGAQGAGSGRPPAPRVSDGWRRSHG